MTQLDPAVCEAARVIALAANAIEVQVFGSAARGEGRDDSDLDLLLVLPDDADLLTATAQVQRALYPSLLDADIVPMHVSHFRNGSSVLARVIAREGVRVYG